MADEISFLVDAMEGVARAMVWMADETASWISTLMFFAPCPILYRVKTPQSELLLHLDDKMNLTLSHWREVNDALPPANPLVLQDGTDRAGFAALVEQVCAGRDAGRGHLQDVTIARAAYERRKAEVHGWVRGIFLWMRAWMRGTDWISAVVPVPGRGQSYEHWWRAAHGALSLWRDLEAAPPPVAGWPMSFRPDCTVEHFAEAVQAFESARWAIAGVEIDLKIARAVRDRALLRVTESLMAYTQCVRGRLPAGLASTVPSAVPSTKRV